MAFIPSPDITRKKFPSCIFTWNLINFKWKSWPQSIIGWNFMKNSNNWSGFNQKLIYFFERSEYMQLAHNKHSAVAHGGVWNIYGWHFSCLLQIPHTTISECSVDCECCYNYSVLRALLWTPNKWRSINLWQREKSQKSCALVVDISVV